MRKLLLQLLLCLGILSGALAQDGQYSSYYAAPLYLNPALTGISDASVRLGGIYRSQWYTLVDPFQHYHFYFDKNKERLSFGMLLNQNNAGKEGFKTTNGLLSLALKKRMAEGNNTLSFGLQLGLIQHRLDFSKLTFDNQYNPEKGYDEELESGELFEVSSTLLPDVNVGVNWQFSKDFGIPIEGNTGISFSHINTPKSSFLNENVQFPLKTTLYGFAEMEFSPMFGIEPYVLFVSQRGARQLLYGLNAAFYINENATLKIGAGSREENSLIFSGSFAFNNLQFGLNYDPNISFAESNRNISSFELSVTYLIGRHVESDLPSDDSKTSNPLADLKDFDGDGINDDQDFCPYEAGSIEFQGCNDSDNDGIWDHMDACPSLPGIVDNYGCPQNKNNLDSDNDGVPDRKDNCVYIPGTKALSGCPDSDGDGIKDLEDDCPYLKGTESNRGCPKTGNRQLSKDVIEFATDQFAIRSLYYPFLDRIAFQLKNRSDLTLILEGHTDDEGDHLYNFQLSKKRANSVYQYLLKKGVKEAQISLHFYGETKPAMRQQSEDARKRNRRVALFLMNP